MLATLTPKECPQPYKKSPAPDGELNRQVASAPGSILKEATMFEKWEQKAEEHSEVIMLWWDRISKALIALAAIAVTIIFAAQTM